MTWLEARHKKMQSRSEYCDRLFVQFSCVVSHGRLNMAPDCEEFDLVHKATELAHCVVGKEIGSRWNTDVLNILR
jgi:hypothetical protein